MTEAQLGPSIEHRHQPDQVRSCSQRMFDETRDARLVLAARERVASNDHSLDRETEVEQLDAEDRKLPLSQLEQFADVRVKLLGLRDLGFGPSTVAHVGLDDCKRLQSGWRVDKKTHVGHSPSAEFVLMRPQGLRVPHANHNHPDDDSS